MIGIIGTLHWDACESCQQYNATDELECCGYVLGTTCMPDIGVTADGDSVFCVEYIPKEGTANG